MSEFKISPEIIKKATEQRILQDAGFPTMPEAAPEIPVVRAPYQIPLPAPVNPLRTPVTAESMGEQAVKDSMRQNVVRHGSIYHPDAAPRPTKQDPPKGDTPSTSPAPTTPSPSTGRNDSAPDGSDAKGTNTGFKGYEIDLGIVNADSARRGGRGMANVNDFLSEQLPVSASEKDVAPEESLVMTDDEFTSAIQGEGNEKYYIGYDFKADPTPAGLRAHAKSLGFDDTKVVEGVSVAGQGEKPGTSPTDTADNNRAISVPGEQKPQKPKKIRGAVDSRFDDGAEYGESYATNYSKSRQARRAAFLDPNVDSSVDAVRNANNAVGIARYGNKFYANDGGTLREIDQSTYDAGRHSKLTAQQLKDGYVEDIKSTLVPVDTPDITSTQTPGSNSNNDSDGFSVDDAVSGGMSQSDAETIGSGGQVETVYTPGGGQEREFDYNNGQPIKSDTYFGQKEKGIQAMKERFFKK